MDRRQLLQRGAIASAGIWSAPAVLSLEAAAAQASPIPPCAASGSAFDAIATGAGVSNFTVGPARSAPPNETSLSVTAVPLPAGGSLGNRVITATADPLPPGWVSFAEVQSASFDLGGLLPIPVTGSDIVLQSTATRDCTTGVTSLSSTVVNANLVVGGTTVAVPASFPPNTRPPGFPLTVTVPGVSTTTVDIVFNEQIGDAVNAFHLVASVQDLVAGIITQTVDLVIAHAEATS